MSRYVCYEDVGRMALSMMGMSNSEWLQALQGLPSIEIIRCRECIDNSINCDGDENWCLRFGYDVEPSDFCSYGERKESE